MTTRSHIFVADLRWFEDRVRGLLRTRQSGAETLEAAFTEDDARLVCARQHGFETWSGLAERIRVLAQTAPEEIAAAEPFMAAFRLLQQSDVSSLARLLQQHPELATAHGTNGNTLLNLAVSLASKMDESAGIAAIDTLLRAGADCDDANDRGWTPLHQAAYSNQTAIGARLVEAGASLEAEAHGSGGTPLIVALFWGHREMADLLGSISTAPDNLRAAAGLGRADLVDACFGEDGALTPQACAARGFYRPHSGFPDWQPSDDRHEILDEALVWAAKCNRVEVLPRLLQAGARLDSDPYRGTALIWAAANNRLETARWLIAHGAPVNQKATFGGPTHGQGITALHLASQHGHLAMVRLLIEHSADAALKDDLYKADAVGTASYFGKAAVRDYLRSIR